MPMLFIKNTKDLFCRPFLWALPPMWRGLLPWLSLRFSLLFCARPGVRSLLLPSLLQKRALCALMCGVISTTLIACQSAAEAPPLTDPPPTEKGREVVIFSLSLLDVGYRFGGKNPEAGLDCSGMVSYVYQQAAGMRLYGSAAMLAQQGKPILRRQLRPGDLVFFNTRGTPFSHVGIYVGEGRFIHAPRSRSQVRVDTLDQGYYKQRFISGRSFF